MRCVDVNDLVYAHRADLPEYDVYRRLLGRLANDDEPLDVADLTLSGFLRGMTNRRVFAEPTSLADASALVDELLAARSTMRLRAGERHWVLYRRSPPNAPASS